MPGDPTFTTSGIAFGVTSDVAFATLTGDFGGYINPSSYFFTAFPTLVQNGQTGLGGVDFLSVSFVSENAIPEPGTLALLGVGLGLLGWRRRSTR